MVAERNENREISRTIPSEANIKIKNPENVGIFLAKMKKLETVNPKFNFHGF